MKIQSLIQDKHSLVPVEVELTLLPGLPAVHFLGLPDQHLKESVLRIKSAIKNAGFSFPTAQQIVVNLRPSQLKKKSQGLELAVAAAYLWKTGQIPAPVMDKDFFVYGELTLQGEVVEPRDLKSFLRSPPTTVMTGRSECGSLVPFQRWSLKHLSEMGQPEIQIASGGLLQPVRPRHLLQKIFSKEQARLLEILALGSHSAILAGPAGSGKSTLAQVLPALMPEPSRQEFTEIMQRQQAFGEPGNWRPVVKPHHSTPVMSMIGGGAVPFAGEISRAHQGLLILDELLEFPSAVQEALREPLEEGRIHIVRAGRRQEFPAQIQAVATTNLCPCGDWTPEKSRQISCRFSSRRCRSYSERLSGPFLDRFQILYFTRGLGELVISGDEILARVLRARECQKQRLSQGLEGGTLDEPSKKWLEDLVDRETMTSQRRVQALQQVARSIADLESCQFVSSGHLQEAYDLCMMSFRRLKIGR
ncbi:MAG: competence protein ComM [Bdellovibrio sp. CG10_big_fil_rev_8_21_14_0_10_47_8]|nr:MAG: competence protein ComM [Bdellovibrio sp. CG10_big_fil_rev_8_21_14_0_10_47_8]